MSENRILVVDDDPTIGEVFTHRLSKQGWSPLTVQEPKQALTLLQEESWHVLVTDIVMPGMDGFSLIKEASQLKPHVPCIAMTGRETPETLNKLILSDCFGYVTKPIDWGYLTKLLEKALTCSRRLQATRRPR
ncbi:MAG: response regulator [Planctomycetota bacterium]|jgi:two-component system response regulator GlrR